MRFAGKVVAITGGGSGIGKETAARFVKEGASVVINGRDLAKLNVAARDIDPRGAKVAVSAGDIADPVTGAALVNLVESRFGGLDVLVNNAGVFNPKPFLDLTEADHDGYLDTILKGKFFTAQAAATAMSGKGGAIVQTGPMWAIQAIGATPSAANAGVHAMVRNLAIELAPAGYPRQRGGPGGCRNAGLQHLSDRSAGGRNAAHLQRLPPLGPQRPAAGRGRGDPVPGLGAGIADHRCGAAGRWWRDRRSAVDCWEGGGSAALHDPEGQCQHRFLS